MLCNYLTGRNAPMLVFVETERLLIANVCIWTYSLINKVCIYLSTGSKPWGFSVSQTEAHLEI